SPAPRAAAPTPVVAACACTLMTNSATAQKVFSQLTQRRIDPDSCDQNAQLKHGGKKRRHGTTSVRLVCQRGRLAQKMPAANQCARAICPACTKAQRQQGGGNQRHG